MTTTLAPLPPVRDRGAPAAARRPLRHEPQLTVVVSPAEALPHAGDLLRRGAALALVHAPADPIAMSGAMAGMAYPLVDPVALEHDREVELERGLAAVERAGFDVRAVEMVAPEALKGRLRALAGDDVSCVVVPGASARRARALARAAQAPVLAIPHGAAPADGPAVLDARDAATTIPPAARCLAADHAVLVAGFEPVDDDTLARTAAHPLLVPRLRELAELRRWDELDDAHHSVELAAVIAAEHAFAAERLVASGPDALLAAARERDGVAVVADDDGWRAPRLLRDALRERRPALLVPRT